MNSIRSSIRNVTNDVYRRSPTSVIEGINSKKVFRLRMKSDGNLKIKSTCEKWIHKYDVVPFRSYGSLPSGKVESWKLLNCDSYFTGSK